MPWLFSYSDLGPHAVKNILGKVPFCSLPASLAGYKVSFKGKSRKWGGAIATLEKSRKSYVYGSALFLPPQDIALIDKYYKSYDKKVLNIFIDATQDKVKAFAYCLKGTPSYGTPNKEYIKAITKHLKFFWGQNDKKNLSLEDFGIITDFSPESPKNKKEQASTK